MVYNIRQENADGTHHDFRVAGDSLDEARKTAHAKIASEHATTGPSIEWRGLVVFVGRRP